jgi:hypothetical protein
VPGQKDAPAGKAAAKAKKKGAPAAGVEWLSLEAGLQRAREKYLPALVLWDPPAPKVLGTDAAPSPSEPKPFLDDYLGDSSIQKDLKQFVCIRLEGKDLKAPYPRPRGQAPAKGGKEAAKENREMGGKEAAGENSDGPTAADFLNLTEGASALLALSFWEEVVKRYEGELPRKTRLHEELARIWKVNKIYAEEARRVDKLLSDSRRAHKLGVIREAVKLVIPLEGEKAQVRMDPVRKKEAQELIESYKEEAKRAIAEADKLDAQRKYFEAIAALDEVAKNYPFKDVIERTNKRRSEILRKLGAWGKKLPGSWMTREAVR